MRALLVFANGDASKLPPTDSGSLYIFVCVHFSCYVVDHWGKASALVCCVYVIVSVRLSQLIVVCTTCHAIDASHGSIMRCKLVCECVSTELL